MPHFGLDYLFVNNAGTLQTDALFLTRSIYDKKKRMIILSSLVMHGRRETPRLFKCFFFVVVPMKIQHLKRYFWRKNIVFLKSITLGLN